MLSLEQGVNHNIMNNLKRVIVDYKKLTSEVLKLLVEKYPDIGSILIECTDMSPWSDKVREATGLPVFDPVDMVKRVNSEVT